MPYEQVDGGKHHGYRHVLFERAELCSACHDVTNPLPIKNRVGRWVGGFPIERTYTEWLDSRYADRPGNRNFDPKFKRDCQTCHMQQHYGQPGTAQTLYSKGAPEPVAARCGRGWRTRAAVLQPSLRRRQRLHAAPDRFFGRRNRNRAAVSKTVGIQFHVRRRDEPVPQRLLDRRR